MRFLPDIGYGTRGYPDKTARRLRLVNAASWIGAALSAAFAVVQALDDTPGMGRAIAVNLLDAVVLSAIPLLHRFGQRVAAVALILWTFVAAVALSLVFGVGSGMYLYLLAAPVLGVLLLGNENVLTAASLGVLAASLIALMHWLLPVNAGLVSPTKLFFANFVPSIVCSSLLLFIVVVYATRQVAHAEAAAEREYQRSEALLANILPRRVAERLKDSAPASIADRYADASILFADMAGFTARAGDTDPGELVRFLDQVFTRLDRLVETRGLEKIKTTGDAYMVVSGVSDGRADHADALADLALDMVEALTGLVDPKGRLVPVRLGIASGPVVAGVVGTSKFFYDVWGDAVNMASRMETTGVPGKIQIAPETRERLAARFELEERGEVEVRGKGLVRTWFLVGRRD